VLDLWPIARRDEDLAYLPEGTAHFGAYVRAVGWAQRHARRNRELMERRSSMSYGSLFRSWRRTRWR
jgi:RNA-splicing ligase RtcB